MVGQSSHPTERQVVPSSYLSCVSWFLFVGAVAVCLFACWCASWCWFLLVARWRVAFHEWSQCHASSLDSYYNVILAIVVFPMMTLSISTLNDDPRLVDLTPCSRRPPLHRIVSYRIVSCIFTYMTFSLPASFCHYTNSTFVPLFSAGTHQYSSLPQPKNKPKRWRSPCLRCYCVYTLPMYPLTVCKSLIVSSLMERFACLLNTGIDLILGVPQCRSKWVTKQ